MENSPSHIRRACRDDLPALLDLYQYLAPGDDRPTPDGAEEILDRFAAYSGMESLLEEVGSFLAASCSLVVVPNLTRGGSPYGLIENVVTHGDFRNRGFGKQMLIGASDAAWQAGCYKVMLMTDSKKQRRLAFI